jgi:hypothetical protein
MRLKIDFISLFDTLDALAGCVVLSKELLSKHSLPETPKILEILATPGKQQNELTGRVTPKSHRYQPVAMHPFIEGFPEACRYAEAAGRLDQELANAYEKCLRYFDVAKTGRPKFSVGLDDEGTSILAYMAGFEDRYVEDYKEFCAIDGCPDSSYEKPFFFPPSHGKFCDDGALRRALQIGFDRSELINFLNQCGIPHSFGNAQPAAVAWVDTAQGTPPVIDQTKIGDVKKRAKETPAFVTRLMAIEGRPQLLPSGVISDCFKECAGWNKEEWRRKLGDADPWLEAARGNPSALSRARAIWHPVVIACALASGVRKKSPDGTIQKVRVSVSRLDRVFERFEMRAFRELWEREKALFDPYA